MPAEKRPEFGIAAELLAGFADAWHRHDVDALARVFREDAGFADVRGTHARGREEIQRQHAAELAGPYQDSVLRVEMMDARRLAPGVVVGHGETELDLADQIRGTVLTLVPEQRPGLWRVATAHNSIVVP